MRTISSLQKFGLLSVTVRAVEFDPPMRDGRVPDRRNRPVMWEARVSNSANGDVTAKRPDPDDALRDAMALFVTTKKPVLRTSEPEDDVSDLI